jgi:photolyase PhrII
VRARPAAPGAFVLYWLRTAQRAHENPSLDAALLAGQSLGLPVFVYQGLSERYPHASDRHHTFILEGARELHAALRARGVGAAFHLERPGHRGPVLKTLASQAALVVTDDFPWAPLEAWLRRVADATAAPVWAVDSACVVPFRLPGRAYDRAFAYRDATAALRQERVSRPWTDVAAHLPPFVPPLPFAPLALEGADLPALVATCEIDHTVGPIPSSPGGATAGYRRWDAFVAEGLRTYAKRRNDPVHPATSRMSSYLHHGMVSPLRLAREAAAQRSEGADKYLDELLVWREVAYTFCAFTPQVDTLAAVPAWARATLAQHQADPRPLPGQEALLRGRTGDALWDACQRSLWRHGELHNHHRMTWGKAVVGWTRDPATALQTLLDLNHRLALDGRDPASYGGILWCLGQFDRPFAPEQPVLGTVRPRPLEAQAKRHDVAAYQALVDVPPRRLRTAAVVGSGLAGLACARVLSDHGVAVTVFDKGRKPGGRLSTREQDGFAFDHGAQFFTARSPTFRRWVAGWAERGLVQRWTGSWVDLAQGRAAPRRMSRTPCVGWRRRRWRRWGHTSPRTCLCGSR